MRVIKNFIYNTGYQLLTIILPIITIPYVSRKLGANGLGIYSFTNAIVQNFALFGTLGITNYAIRQVAYFRDDPKKLNYTFNIVFFFQLLLASCSLLIYFIFVLTKGRQYLYIYLIQALMIVSAGIDVSWLFIGLEDFKKNVVRNTVVKIVGLILILLFVKGKKDVFLYALILSITQFTGQLLMFPYVYNLVDVKIPHLKEMVKIFLPVFLMFIPQIGIQVYTVMNKIFLGILDTKVQTGYFDVSDKISRIAVTIPLSVISVMYPRISNLYSKNDEIFAKEEIVKTIQIVHLVSFPLCMGIVGCSKWMIPWFFGKGYLPVIKIVSIMASIVIIMSFSTAIGDLYLLAKNHMKAYIRAIFAGSCISVIGNFLLIPILHAIGAAYSVVLAELIVLIVMLYEVKNELPIIKFFNNIYIYFLNSFMMFIVVYTVGLVFNTSSILTTFAQILIGIIIYVFLTIIDVTWARDYAIRFFIKIKSRI